MHEIHRILTSPEPAVTYAYLVPFNWPWVHPNSVRYGLDQLQILETLLTEGNIFYFICRKRIVLCIFRFFHRLQG